MMEEKCISPQDRNDSGAYGFNFEKGLKCVLHVLDDSSTKFRCALEMSMLEDRSNYVNVSESAQDTDTGLGEADSETSPKRKSILSNPPPPIYHLSKLDQFIISAKEAISLTQDYKLKAVVAALGEGHPNVALDLSLQRNAAAVIEICSVVVPLVDSRPVVDNKKLGTLRNKEDAAPIVQVFELAGNATRDKKTRIIQAMFF
ncbi:hypothetical protein Tco_0200699 [Tanacetum coccineum]